MVKLDLHGMKHQDIEMLVENWIILEYNKGNTSVQIITGNSEKMKSIVIKVLNRIDINYRIGDYLGFNKGYIQTY